jgi:hypothetical protein
MNSQKILKAALLRGFKCDETASHVALFTDKVFLPGTVFLVA